MAKIPVKVKIIYLTIKGAIRISIKLYTIDTNLTLV